MRLVICAAAAVLATVCAESSLAATCKAYSLYASGVTPQTKTRLSGQNALAVSVHKNGGCGWGTSNKQPSLEAAEAQALAKCQLNAANTACKIVGRNGVIVAGATRPTNDAKNGEASVKSATHTAATVPLKEEDKPGSNTTTTARTIEPHIQIAQAVGEDTRAHSASGAVELQTVFKCGALSTEPSKFPDFNYKLTLAISNGTITAERETNDASTQFNGSVNNRGIIRLFGTGHFTDGRDGWTYTLSGELQSKGETVLRGQLRNGWGKGNGKRTCSLVFLSSPAEIKLAFSTIDELKRGQQELGIQQTETNNRVEQVTSVLKNIILPVTEDPNAWMLRVAAVPVQQQQFCRIVDQFYGDLAQAYQARNDIKRNALYRDRQMDMAALLPHGEFENWVVQIKEVTQAPDGSAAVMLQPPCRAMLGSDACQKEGSKIRATVGTGSPLYRELARVSAGDFVVVSGKILYAESTNPDQPLPTYAVYQAGSHCSTLDGSKQEDVFVTEIRYLVQLR